ncbi:MAG: AraC family transcriptional regulator [Marinifilaceae bacterium]
MIKRQDGFAGQRALIIPQSIVNEIERHAVASTLYITDIGYYPKAKHHFRERKEKISQHILIYCIGGSGWYTVDNVTYTVEANSYFILPANKPHCYGANADDPWTIYWIHFKGTHTGAYMPLQQGPIALAPGINSRISYRIELFEEIMNVLELGYSWDNLLYVFSILHHFMGSLRFLKQFRRHDGTKDKKEDPITGTIHFMKENIEKRLTLEQIAGFCGYSVSHFSTLFSRSTGHAPLAYFNQLKVQYACQILDNTDMKINQVCFKIGIDDSYYFSRLFTKVMGMSPTQYRQLKKG